MDYCQIQTGIKTAETINIIVTDPEIQVQACAFNASGSTTLTQRTITVGKSKAEMKWCENDLETKFTSEKLKKGSTYDSLTYNTQIIEDTMQRIAKKQEICMWLGDTASGDQNLKQFDGFVKIIGAANIGGTYSGTTWSVSASRTIIQGILNLVVALPDVWRGGSNNDLKFFCSPEVAQNYRTKLVIDNLYHITGTEQKLYVEGTDIEIVSVPGLSGTKYIYAMESSNMYAGVDLQNEQESYDVWFSKDNQELRFSAKWKLGCQVAFPLRICKYLGI
jgi:hypothetical protein